MLFRQIYEEGLAQASYLFGCAATGEAMVIDPRRDIDVYLEEARRHGLRIVVVGETHIRVDGARLHEPTQPHGRHPRVAAAGLSAGGKRYSLKDSLSNGQVAHRKW